MCSGVGEGVLRVGAVVLDMERVFYCGCRCPGYDVGVLDYQRVFLGWVWFFWIRIICSGVRAGVVV